MSWTERNNWPNRAQDALNALAARGIPVPESVNAAVAVLRAVEQRKPEQPAQTLMRELFIQNAEQPDIDAALLADLGYTRLASEWSQGRINAAGAVLAAVQASADEIMPKLREEAEEAIAKLVNLAAIGGASLDALIRDGRDDDARLVADADIIAASLDACYELRDRFLTVGGGVSLAVNGCNASRWEDPEAAAAHARGATPAERYIAGLRAGLVLWCPTPQEAIAVAHKIADRRAAEAERIRAEQFGIGSTVFLGA